MTKILVLPDVQVKEGQNFTFLTNIGKYAVEKQPDIIVCIGDFADMESLSSYDVGKKSFEGRRYVKDISAAKEAMQAFLSPIWQYNEKQKKQKGKLYKPRLVLTLGNHEDRITRAVNGDAKLEGVLSLEDLGYKKLGWEVYPFLDVVVINGVAFSHYFVSGVLGRPVPSASACITKKHMSCVQGHQQGLQIATGHKADGAQITAVICGSCYEHNEDYMGPQGNNHWRGFLMLHDVHDGQFDLMPVSLSYLGKKYGKSEAVSNGS